MTPRWRFPLGTLTAGRVENLYDLMDAAYDSIEIWAHSILLGHKPIIDVNPRRSVDMKEALKREKKARRALGLVFPEERRYVERSGSERVNGRLKDEFGGRHVRVRRLRQGSGPPHVWHDRSDGQPTDAPYRSADLVRLVSFAITVAALLERRCGQTRPKFDENTESEAVPTLIRPWSPSKSHQLPCPDVVASLGVLAPLRIDQSFARGSLVWVFLRRSESIRILQAAHVSKLRIVMRKSFPSISRMVKQLKCKDISWVRRNPEGLIRLFETGNETSHMSVRLMLMPHVEGDILQEIRHCVYEVSVCALRISRNSWDNSHVGAIESECKETLIQLDSQIQNGQANS